MSTRKIERRRTEHVARMVRIEQMIAEETLLIPVRAENAQLEWHMPHPVGLLACSEPQPDVRQLQRAGVNAPRVRREKVCGECVAFWRAAPGGLSEEMLAGMIDRANQILSDV